jgi:hypothetical protein
MRAEVLNSYVYHSPKAQDMTGQVAKERDI